MSRKEYFLLLQESRWVKWLTGRVRSCSSVPPDLSNWELKTDPKQSVSEDLYDQFKDKLDVRAEDLFVVRDGTYLVGTSCILTEHDTRILYCGGLYKIRVRKKDQLDPYLLLALLNCPIVKR